MSKHTEQDKHLLALEAMAAQALKCHKQPLGKLISLFENSHEQAIARRQFVMDYLSRESTGTAKIFGFTGTPGAGKSTLIGELATLLLQHDDQASIAVLAVDPSSQISGGALLGDRTRVCLPPRDKRFFFRSQASKGEFGGVSYNTFQVLRLLRHCFKYVFIETVGIGQTEIEIQQLAEHTCLVMQPFAGDQIQFMKSGIMEIPNTYIVNKCDEEALAKQSYHLLNASLKQISRPANYGDKANTPPAIFMVSALNKIGLQPLVEHLVSTGFDSGSFVRQEQFYLQRWLQDEYGRSGLARLNKHSTVSQIFQEGESFESKQASLVAVLGDGSA